MIFRPDVFVSNAKVAVEHIEEVYKRLLEWVNIFEKHYNISDITTSRPILLDVIRKTLEDLIRYGKDFNPYQHIDIPNHFKEAAHLAYWIRRLKPLTYIPNVKHPVNIEYQKEYVIWINEKVAIKFAEYICYTGEKERDSGFNVSRIPHALREDFLNMFRYKHISPHALMIILRSAFS